MFLSASITQCPSPKLCSALNSRAYGDSFLHSTMLHIRDARHHLAPFRHPRSSLSRSSSSRPGKSSAPTAPHSLQASASETTTDLPKCTSRLKAEKCGDCLASSMVGEKDSPVSERQTGRYVPEIRKVLQKHRNRERMPDWLAEDPVACELSSGQFPANREKYREYRISQPLWDKYLPENTLARKSAFL
jgi:hypothetical protein